MKNLFNINISTYIYFLIILFSGYINYFLIFILIMFFHEVGHIIVIILLKYKIESITIMPYGGIIKTNCDLNISNNKMFIISISGIISQLLLFIIISDKFIYYNIFKSLNTFLIVYNLLPIIPNDGYKMLLSILNKFLSFKISNYISYLVSLIMLIIFLKLTSNIIIFTILYFHLIKSIIDYKYTYNKFLLERYLYINKYKKDKYICNYKDFYKEYDNNLISNGIIINEKDYLKQLFSSMY